MTFPSPKCHVNRFLRNKMEVRLKWDALQRMGFPIIDCQFLYYFWCQPSLFVCCFVVSSLSLPAPLDKLFFHRRYLSLQFIWYLECQLDLGMENGAISARQITASSQLDANHAATQCRLNFKATANKAGSWSAGSNDSSQWLQVYLGIQSTKVTRVATQGRDDSPQWVTKYKLQYSNNGVKFLYYTEPGRRTNRVRIRLKDHELVKSKERIV